MLIKPIYWDGYYLMVSLFQREYWAKVICQNNRFRHFRKIRNEIGYSGPLILNRRKESKYKTN